MSSPGTEALDRVLPKLTAVRPEGTTGRSWVALCPAHDDHSPSLLVTLNDDGKVLLHCRSHKCPTKDVCRAMGLTQKDLFPKTDGSVESRIVKEYAYRDADGKLIFHVVRLKDPKDFRQRAASGEWKTKGLPRVPYRYPELLRAPEGEVVYVVEGEKDVDNLVPLGFVATTNPGGSGKWRMLLKAAVVKAFTGRTVVVIPDNDEPGELHAVDVATRLKEIAASVKVLKLPGVKDVSDWIAAGGTRDKLVELTKGSTINPDDPSVVRKHTVDSVSRPGARPFTDYGNAQRLVDRRGLDIRYVAAVGQWFIWDKRHMRADELNVIQEYAKETVRGIYGEAAGVEDREARDAIVGHARRSESARSIAALVALAKSDPAVAIGTDRLDADPYLLNCPNGTVDLRTGAIREHRREDLITKLCPTEYDPTTTCPLWERTLDLIFPAAPVTSSAADATAGPPPGNRPLIAYIQRLFGLASTGLVRATLPIFFGNGANGKSTVLNTVLDVLGKAYAMQAPHNFLMAKHGESHPTDQADLLGMRLVAVSETEKGKKLDTALVKGLTGGEAIRARRMKKDFFEFRPTHTLILCTNHRPRIPDTDDGIWRRVSLVPFAVKFWDPDRGDVGPEHLRQDKSLPERLRVEYRGILAWIVRGAMAFLKDGLGESPEVRTETEDYRSGENVVGQFFAERVVNATRDERVALKDLYKAYVEWCEQNGERYLSNRTFAGELRGMGHTLGRGLSDGGVAVMGIRLVVGTSKTLDDIVPD